MLSNSQTNHALLLALPMVYWTLVSPPEAIFQKT